MSDINEYVDDINSTSSRAESVELNYQTKKDGIKIKHFILIYSLLVNLNFKQKLQVLQSLLKYYKNIGVNRNHLDQALMN